MQFPREIEELKERLTLPALLAEKAPYLLKFAEREEEFSAILRLRYKVFNQEQGKGLAESHAAGCDRDEFDPFCSHLYVWDQEKKAVAGTYRIQLGPLAAHTGLGFYSEREFAFSGLDAYAPMAVETGRSCVDPAYRNGSVIALLWSGFSIIMRRTRLRYLFGCVSLEETAPEAGWLLYDHFFREGKKASDITAAPREKYLLPRPDDAGCRAFLEEKGGDVRKLIPPLFKGYLRMGAKILGEPAFDPDFGSIDFPILLDVAKLPESYVKHFHVAEVKK